MSGANNSDSNLVDEPQAKRRDVEEQSNNGDILLAGQQPFVEGTADTGGASTPEIEWRSEKELLNKLLDATKQIANNSSQPSLPASAEIPADFPTTISTNAVVLPLDVSRATILLTSAGAGIDGVQFPVGASGEPSFVTTDSLSAITGFTTPTVDKIGTFNKLLNAICTITTDSYFKTPKCSTLRRILADFIHDAHAHARDQNVGSYMDTAMGGLSCSSELSAMYSRLLTLTGSNRPSAIHEEIEKIMKEMGVLYKGVLTGSLANSLVEEDVSVPAKATAFAEKLRTTGIRYIMIDSQSGNPVCKIFASPDGTEPFKILNTVASEADGASKLSDKKTRPVNIAVDSSLLTGITLPVRNMFANRTHEISYEGGPKIVVKDGNKVPPNTIITLTGTAGFSINGLCNAAGAPFPRKGKSPKTITVTTGPGIDDLTKKPETLTIKPFTDLAQVYFAALLYHVYGIKTVFVTMDSYCLYVAALFCLPVVMYAHPGGQRIYSFAKNVFQLTPAQVQTIHGNLSWFAGKTWNTFKDKITAIRSYFWKIYNNTPFIVPFILASRVLTDIEQYERESMEKFKSIQEALTVFANPSASPLESFQHIQNHAALANYTIDSIENYIFNDQQFLTNVGDIMEELHSVLTKGKDSIQENLHSKGVWSDLEGTINNTISELSTILTEYGIREDHTELINIYIAQQLIYNRSMINYTDIPAGYEIYFKYWAVFMILFGVVDGVIHTDGIWGTVRGGFTSLDTFKHIIYTVPIRLYLDNNFPVQAGTGPAFTVNYSQIVAAIESLKENQLKPVRRSTRETATTVTSDAVLLTIRSLIETLSGETSIFKPVGGTTHDFFQFVECALSMSSSAGALTTACPDIIKRVLTYISNNIDAAYRGNSLTVALNKSFESNFNVTINQHGGGDSDDEDTTPASSDIPAEELAAMLGKIRAMVAETNVAAAVYATVSDDTAHASIENSVDEAIAAARSALTGSASSEDVRKHLLTLLYSLRYDAEESHEGVKYLAEYYNLTALLAQITDLADIHMILRYYLVQNEWVSKYTTSLIPADVIKGFLTQIDRLFLPVPRPSPVNTSPYAGIDMNATLSMGDDNPPSSGYATPVRGGSTAAGYYGGLLTQNPSLITTPGVVSPISTTTGTPLGGTSPQHPSVKPAGNGVGRKLFAGATADNANITMGGGRRRTAGRRRQSRRLRGRQQRRSRRRQQPRHKSDMPIAE